MCKVTQALCAKLIVGAEAIPKLLQNLCYHPAAEIATIQAPVLCANLMACRYVVGTYVVVGM